MTGTFDADSTIVLVPLDGHTELAIGVEAGRLRHALSEPLAARKGAVRPFDPGLATTLTGGAAQALTLARSAQLYELTPATAELLRSGAFALDTAADGSISALLRAGSGEIGAHARFVPASGVLGLAATAGPALASVGLAIQMQQLQRAIDDVAEAVARLERAREIEARSRIERHAVTVRRLEEKVEAGHDLTSNDETRLREVRDELLDLATQARLSIDTLGFQSTDDDGRSLSEHAALLRMVRSDALVEHLRLTLLVEALVASIDQLKAVRAAIIEPDYLPLLEHQLATERGERVTWLYGVVDSLNGALEGATSIEGASRLRLRERRRVGAGRQAAARELQPIVEALERARPLISRTTLELELPILAPAEVLFEPSAPEEALRRARRATGRQLASLGQRLIGDAEGVIANEIEDDSGSS